jgi:acyl-coenzyme A synthetase/AMP-(fatty) acid ligase
MLMTGENVPLPSLKRMSCSSAALSAEEQKAFDDRWEVPVYQLYGTTEHGWISGNRVGGGWRLGSVGGAAPGVLVGIDEMTGEVVADLMPTGDLGHFDGDGFLWLTGRKALIINRGGVKINPANIEAGLLKLKDVTEALVIAKPHPIYGEEPEAFMVSNLGGAASAPWQGLGPGAHWTFPVHEVPYLPRNERGKLIRDRATLLQLADDHLARKHFQELRKHAHERPT